MALKRASRVVARRYARALLEVVMAGARDAASGPEAVRAALEEARTLLARDPQLLRALNHPAVPTAARQRIVAAVWPAAPALVGRLLNLLVERDRVELLPAITEAFGEAWNEARGVIAATAVSAVALDPAQGQALAAALEQRTGQSVELQTKVEPSVLGGLRVTLGGLTLDGTVEAQLRSLRRRLQGAA